ncbi:NAD(P)/FAD-dependent oxidoreductase [Balneolales bacterium ANBcel1]|nr:NAD(P)/FAD-dependent oxidoreductase [Balneolales bacterium ANBcel1]
MKSENKAYEKKIVIVGAGFGGLKAAHKLKRYPVDITVIDKTNHHLFQPLLYQVATAALAPGDIAIPARTIFKNDRNVSVLMGEVTTVDKERRVVCIDENRELPFDYLILAPGARHSYFGNEHWEERAPGLKTLSDALDIRESILLSFEKAEREQDAEERKKFETFVVVGGGPTGVEVAGAIAEIASRAVREDYKNADPELLEIHLIEGQSRILGMYDDRLGERAIRDLEKMGVTVWLNSMLTDIDDDGVTIQISGEEEQRTIRTENVIWAAGNAASPLLRTLDIPLENDGRLHVNQDLSVPGHDRIFVIGDAAKHVNDNGRMTPAIAPGAIQQGDHAAGNIIRDLKGKARTPFSYFDKGSMATIGRAKAVAEIGGQKFTGFFAWLLWSVVHVFFLIGFRNRFRVMAEWVWYYLTFRGGSQLITRKRISPPERERDESVERNGRDEREKRTEELHLN